MVHDVQLSAVAALVKDSAAGAASPKQMVLQLGQPRTIWLMVPAAVGHQAIGDLAPLLDAGDIVVDGGNSHCLDVGTSGGVAGLVIADLHAYLKLSQGIDARLLQMFTFLIDYPFADRLYPRILEVIERLNTIGLAVALSDGDVMNSK
jgi:hypothetical protein